jgi:mRNA deadenylase 3'-5' endonuclease subunit Ccr4
MPALASVFLADSSSAVIPGMSSVQAKMRRMRPHSIAPSRPGATPTVELRVLSYDLLAQVNTPIFTKTPEAALSWPYRSQNLLLEIRQRNSDVLCLQEVSFYKEFWQQNLKGYQAVYQSHPDPTSAKCVAVLSRPSKLALRQAVPVRFSDEDQAFRSVAVIGIYETAASVALKEKDPRAPRTMFVIASVALSHYGDETKQLQQAGVLLAAIDRARATCTKDQAAGSRNVVNINVIMSGNFNCVPGSVTYNLLCANAPSFVSDLQLPQMHTIPLASAYASFQGLFFF